MNLKPWREVMKPHADVISGESRMADFAADLTQVVEGNAPAQYQNPAFFYQYTYITAGTRELLLNVARRLQGKGGDPVIQLQTGFGGGKTHTMLAVYHMAKSGPDVALLMGLKDLLRSERLLNVPRCPVAVLDGVHLGPAEPKHVKLEDGRKLAANTLWGVLAAELGGVAGYEAIRASDEAGVSPGKEALIELLKAAAPCVILIDELVAYVRQFNEGEKLLGGTFASNLSFIQALTEAVKSVDGAVLLASLPESVREVGGTQGQKTLDAVSQHFGRLQALWRPVEREESFEIVRRRLFEDPSSVAEREKVCDAFCKLYQEKGECFPSEAQQAAYREKLLRSYPIHPEVFDELYANWTTLERFQRTRGVLKMMSNAIHYLWAHDNKDLMILPGSLPLGDVQTQGIFTEPLTNTGWPSIISTDIDGEGSEAAALDLKNTRYGAISACRRVARTVFLATAPGTSTDMHRGIGLKSLMLGTVSPGEEPAAYQDALHDLCKVCHFLYADGEDRAWFGVAANLTTEMQARRAKLKSVANTRGAVLPLLEESLSARGSFFKAVHPFTASGDIPDDDGLRLVIVPIEKSWSSEDGCAAKVWARDVLEHRGQAQRVCRNRLVFLASDAIGADGMQEDAATWRAWKSIVDDSESGKLNLDGNSLKEAKSRCADAKKYLVNRVSNSFIHLMSPGSDRGFVDMYWEDYKIQPGLSGAVEAVQEKLLDEECLISRWAPVHLGRILKENFWDKGRKRISASEFWGFCAKELAFPRLAGRQVLEETLRSGVETRDFFGLAQSAAGEDNYLGFAFGKAVDVVLDDSLLILSPEEAVRYEARLAPPPESATQKLVRLLHDKWAAGARECPVDELLSALASQGVTHEKALEAVDNAVVNGEAAVAQGKSANGYAGLVKGVNLTPEQKGAVRGLLFVNPKALPGIVGIKGDDGGVGGQHPPVAEPRKLTGFTCTLQIDPQSPKSSVLDALDRLGILFGASSAGITVELQLDVHASAPGGFNEQQVRALKENLTEVADPYFE